MGTWIYDGGDLAAVVRGGTFVRESANITSSINGSFINDDMLSRCRFSMENYGEGICFSARADSTFSSTKGPKPQNSDQGSDKITPFTITNTKLEPAGSAQNKLGIESPATVSSPPAAPLYLKSPPTSPTKTAATLDNSAQKEVVESSSSAIKTESNTHSLTKLSGAKRRKSQQRRIMCVPAVAGSWNKQGGTGVPSDLWAWRKYGQKPIKGSPYPRGYYRCSSSKGCPARKQIERSHTDPTMLVITYTAEHNHSWPTQRSALTRSSRQNAFHDKVQPLSEPRHSVSNIKLDLSAARSPAKRSSDNICPVDESAKHSRQKPGGLFNHFHTNGVENEDRDGYANLDVMLSANHMHDHDLFADLGELPQLYPKDLTVHSDHEEAATTVPADPFNLFNWSSATNITAE